jgi:hypothetical protein
MGWEGAVIGQSILFSDGFHLPFICLEPAKQALYHFSHTPRPFVLIDF